MTEFTSTNSLLVASALPKFSAFKACEVKPALQALIARCEEALSVATSDLADASFQRLSEVLDGPLEALGDAWGTVTHLQAVLDSPELRAAVAETEPLVTAFFSKYSSDERLYSRMKEISEREGASLNDHQRKAVQDRLRDGRLAGAELAPAQKNEFVEVEQKLAELSRKFSNQLLDATDAFAYWATAEELEGLPPGDMQRMREAAKTNGRSDVYLVTLHQPSMVPVMQYCHDRQLRETVYRASVTRASEFGPSEMNNGPVIEEILALRQRRASLLGLGDYATVSLVPKMAGSPEEVIEFLLSLGRRGRAKGEIEIAELQAFARENLGLASVEPWDVPYVTEQLRQSRYAFSEEVVKEHFRLDTVLNGMFDIAEKLFGIEIRTEQQDTWHPSVTTYSIWRNDELVGHFYLDPFARSGKRAGAWMNGARPRWRRTDGSLRTAVAFLVTDFAEPAQGQQALLRHSDVVTLFHEFGHGLHFLLSEVDVRGVSGIYGVEWDAVELPSQLMENFAWQWSVLEQITMDTRTEQGLPRDLFEKMSAARNFQVGLWLLRQVELALYDMRLHSGASAGRPVQAVIDEVRAEVSVLAMPAFNRFQNGFSHIFAGVYSAGYYSYLWADVLSSDVWEAFEAAGVTDVTTGRRYLDTILSRGGSRPMKVNFEAFRGRPPKVDALLRQRGLAGPGDVAAIPVAAAV